jgi:hypothetical protein
MLMYGEVVSLMLMYGEVVSLMLMYGEGVSLMLMYGNIFCCCCMGSSVGKQCRDAVERCRALSRPKKKIGKAGGGGKNIFSHGSDFWYI